MKTHRNTHPAVKVLSLLIPILIIALILVLRDIAGFRIGSDTDFGVVCKLNFQGQKGYHWYILNKDGTVKDDDFTTAEPYIWQDGNRISLALQEHDGEKFPSDMFFRNAEFLNYYLDNEEIDTVPQEVPAISKKLEVRSEKIEAVESGSEYVKINRFVVPEIQNSLYSWAVCDAWGEELGNEFSTTLPEVIPQDNGSIQLFYTERDENEESVQIFNPQESDFSHSYHTEKNRTVFIEQAFEYFNFYMINYDESIARRENFVNNDFIEEICSIEDAYVRAKNEVTIPYSLVTFRCDFIINDEYQKVDFWFWEVTFSQMDNPDGEAQTVYLDSLGKTILILDGKPDSV